MLYAYNAMIDSSSMRHAIEVDPQITNQSCESSRRESNFGFCISAHSEFDYVGTCRIDAGLYRRQEIRGKIATPPKISKASALIN